MRTPNPRTKFFVTDHTRQLARNWGVGAKVVRNAIITLSRYFKDCKLELSDEFMWFRISGISYCVVGATSMSKRLIFKTPSIPPYDRIIFVYGNTFEFKVFGIYEKHQVRYKKIRNGYEAIPEDIPMTKEAIPLISYIESKTVGMLHQIASAKDVCQSDVVSIETYIDADDEDVFRMWYWASKPKLMPDLAQGKG